MAIGDLFEKWKIGEESFGTVIFHKKPHKCSGDEDFVCLRGVLSQCEGAYKCPNCFTKKEGIYCLRDGQNVGGLLIQEEKHKSLVTKNSYGAHYSFERAVEYHSKNSAISLLNN